MTDAKSLYQQLDDCAQALLGQAFPATNSGGAPVSAEQVTIAERIKAFEAAVKWANERKDLIPPEREKGKGESLRDKFYGRKAGGGGRSAQAKAVPANGAGDFSACLSDGTNGSGGDRSSSA